MKLFLLRHEDLRMRRQISVETGSGAFGRADNDEIRKCHHLFAP